MESESVNDQIVKKFAFQVEAVPQKDVVDATSTTKIIPISLKIKVRKKDDAIVNPGVLSVPRHGQPGSPRTIRLVSSDQTVMSFNVFMESDFEKKPLQKPRRHFFARCLGAEYENDDPPYTAYKLNKSNGSNEIDGVVNENFAMSKNYIDIKQSRRENDIFGKCKPGGCLDPPFGEEKYSYKLATPSQEKDSSLLPLTKGNADERIIDETKYQGSDEKQRLLSDQLMNKAHEKSKSKDDISIPKASDKDIVTSSLSTLSLYQTDFIKSSLDSKYSDSIITYPPPASSIEMCSEKHIIARSRVSSEDKSMKSYNDLSADTYFIHSKSIKSCKEQNMIQEEEKSHSNLNKGLENNVIQENKSMSLLDQHYDRLHDSKRIKDREYLKQTEINMNTNDKDVGINIIKEVPKVSINTDCGLGSTGINTKKGVLRYGKELNEEETDDKYSFKYIHTSKIDGATGKIFAMPEKVARQGYANQSKNDNSNVPVLKNSDIRDSNYSIKMESQYIQKLDNESNIELQQCNLVDHTIESAFSITGQHLWRKSTTKSENSNANNTENFDGENFNADSFKDCDILEQQYPMHSEPVTTVMSVENLDKSGRKENIASVTHSKDSRHSYSDTTQLKTGQLFINDKINTELLNGSQIMYKPVPVNRYSNVNQPRIMINAIKENVSDGHLQSQRLDINKDNATSGTNSEFICIEENKKEPVVSVSNITAKFDSQNTNAPDFEIYRKSIETILPSLNKYEKITGSDITSFHIVSKTSNLSNHSDSYIETFAHPNTSVDQRLYLENDKTISRRDSKIIDVIETIKDPTVAEKNTKFNVQHVNNLEFETLRGKEPPERLLSLGKRLELTDQDYASFKNVSNTPVSSYTNINTQLLVDKLNPSVKQSNSFHTKNSDEVIYGQENKAFHKRITSQTEIHSNNNTIEEDITKIEPKNENEMSVPKLSIETKGIKRPPIKETNLKIDQKFLNSDKVPIMTVSRSQFSILCGNNKPIRDSRQYSASFKYETSRQRQNNDEIGNQKSHATNGKAKYNIVEKQYPASDLIPLEGNEDKGLDSLIQVENNDNYFQTNYAADSRINQNIIEERNSVARFVTTENSFDTNSVRNNLANHHEIIHETNIQTERDVVRKHSASYSLSLQIFKESHASDMKPKQPEKKNDKDDLTRTHNTHNENYSLYATDPRPQQNVVKEQYSAPYFFTAEINHDTDNLRDNIANHRHVVHESDTEHRHDVVAKQFLTPYLLSAENNNNKNDSVDDNTNYHQEILANNVNHERNIVGEQYGNTYFLSQEMQYNNDDGLLLNNYRDNNKKYNSQFVGENESSVNSKLKSKTNSTWKHSKESNKELIDVALAFQSYRNDENIRIFKTIDILKDPQRRPQDSIISMNTQLNRNSQKIKIPIDFEKYIEFGMTNDILRHDSSLSIDVDTSFEPNDVENSINKILHSLKISDADALQAALTLIYEQQLIPLRTVIKDLKQQVEFLANQQLWIKNQLYKTKRTKELRFIPTNKACGCISNRN